MRELVYDIFGGLGASHMGQSVQELIVKIMKGLLRHHNNGQKCQEWVKAGAWRYNGRNMIGHDCGLFDLAGTIGKVTMFHGKWYDKDLIYNSYFALPTPVKKIVFDLLTQPFKVTDELDAIIVANSTEVADNEELIEEILEEQDLYEAEYLEHGILAGQEREELESYNLDACLKAFTDYADAVKADQKAKKKKKE